MNYSEIPLSYWSSWSVGFLEKASENSLRPEWELEIKLFRYVIILTDLEFWFCIVINAALVNDGLVIWRYNERILTH